MSGDVTYQAIKRLAYLPNRDASDNGTTIGGQDYDDVFFIGGSADGVTMGTNNPQVGRFTSVAVTGNSAPDNGIFEPTNNTLGFSSNSTMRGGINQNGVMFLGGTSQAQVGSTPLFQVQSAGGNTGLNISNWLNSFSPIRFTNSIGTNIGDHGALSSGATIGQADFYGDDGTSYIQSVSFKAVVDGTVSTGIVPGRFDISTKDTSGVLHRVIRWDSQQNTILNNAALATTATGGFLWVPSCAGPPTGVLTPPYTGAVALAYDSTNNKLYVNNGGWKSVTLT